MGLPGITDSLIASIIYSAGKKIWSGFNDLLIKAINETEIYFSKEKKIEIKSERLKEIINSKFSIDEIEKFKNGDNFIDGDELAVQFAIFGDLYIEDENKILDLSRDIFSYFRSAFEKQLLTNPSSSNLILANYQKNFHKVTSIEHKKISDDIQSLKNSIDAVRRRIEKNGYKKLSRSFKFINTKEIIPKDILGTGIRSRVTSDFYWEREIDAKILKTLQNHQSVIILGNSLAGKTQALYEALKKIDNAIIIFPPDDYKLDSEFKFPDVSREKFIAVFDDIEEILIRYSKYKFENLIYKLLDKEVILACTCRTGNEWRYFASTISHKIRENFKEIIIDRMTYFQIKEFKEYKSSL